MKKLLNIVRILALGFCVGTVIAQLLTAAVLWPKLKLDRGRFSQIVAIAQGVDVSAKEDANGSTQFEGEQPSFQQIVEARAVKYRNLELREQQLRNNLAQVQSEESKLADDMKKSKQLRDAFNAQLAEMRQNSTSAGMEEMRRTLESIKPKQAKDLLLEMLDKKEIDDVVLLLSQMPDKKRANIIGEFKNDDLEKLSVVLRRLREGQPETKAVENAQAKLESKKTP